MCHYVLDDHKCVGVPFISHKNPPTKIRTIKFSKRHGSWIIFMMFKICIPIIIRLVFRMPPAVSSTSDT